MNRPCLICESRAVMTRDAAKGLALLVGLIDGAARCARSTPGECHRDMLMNRLAAITPTYPAALDAAEDVADFHFRRLDCPYLRCGALFEAAVAY